MQDAHSPNPSTSAPSHEIQSRGKLTSIAAEKKLGVLLLHGFTSSLDAVSGLVPHLEAHHIEYEMPVLRGHNSKPEDLRGVTAEDWYTDAFNALKKLSERVDQVVVIGLSMGGLVALHLCIREHALKNKICACITWAAALGFCNPLAWLAKPLSLFIPNWKGQESFHDPECRKNNHNYQTFPTKAFVELYDFAAKTRTMLDDISVPLCIIHSKRDQVVPYKTALMLYHEAGNAACELHSLRTSGHELGQDSEAETVFNITMEYIDKLTHTAP
ncbi:MAG: alpha/beta fold hydrolase [Proteobacteria bacterium]|nr:alpha/beta fold hydrolase [Pseudomonadota bacterium]